MDRRPRGPVRVSRGCLPAAWGAEWGFSPARPTPMSVNLAALYADHLDTLKRRAFDALVVPSGRLHYQVFDDRDYPYAVNPQFKAWVPLVKLPDSWLVYAPGQRPKVIYLQPFDYWHVVPSAPSGDWVEH